MDELTIDDWMVAWTPGQPGAVKVGRWPDDTGWSDAYSMTSGCCYVERRAFDRTGKAMMLFIDFHSLVVGYGIDPRAAHREFLQIDEYRRRISPDIEGADE